MGIVTHFVPLCRYVSIDAISINSIPIWTYCITRRFPLSAHTAQTRLIKFFSDLIYLFIFCSDWIEFKNRREEKRAAAAAIWKVDTQRMLMLNIGSADSCANVLYTTPRIGTTPFVWRRAHESGSFQSPVKTHMLLPRIFFLSFLSLSSLHSSLKVTQINLLRIVRVCVCASALCNEFSQWHESVASKAHFKSIERNAIIRDYFDIRWKCVQIH